MAMADNGLPGSPRPDSAWEHAALAWHLLDVFQRILRAMRGGREGASGSPSAGVAGVGISGATVRQALYRMGGESLRPEPEVERKSEPKTKPKSKPKLKSEPEPESAARPAFPFLPRSRVASSMAGTRGRGLAHESGPERRMRRGGGRRGVAPGLRVDRPTERPGGLSRLSGLSGHVFEGAAGGAGGVSARRGRTHSAGGPVAPWGGASGHHQVSWGGVSFRPGLPAPQGAAGQTGSSSTGAGRITQEQLAEPEAEQAKNPETFAQAMLRAILPGEALSRMRTVWAGGAVGGHGVSPAQSAPFPARTAHWPQAGTPEPSGLLPSVPHAAGAYARGMHAAVQAAMARTVPGPTATDISPGSTASREVLAKTRMDNDAFSTRTGAEARGVSGLKAQARHANMGMR